MVFCPTLGGRELGCRDLQGLDQDPTARDPEIVPLLFSLAVLPPEALKCLVSLKHLFSILSTKISVCIFKI